MNGQGINLKKEQSKDIVGSLMVHPLDWLSVGGSFVKGKGCAVAASSVNPDIAIGDSYTQTAGRQAPPYRQNLSACVPGIPCRQRDGGCKKRRILCESRIPYVYFPNSTFGILWLISKQDKARDYKQKQLCGQGVQWWFYPKCRLQAQYTLLRSPKGKLQPALLGTIYALRFWFVNIH